MIEDKSNVTIQFPIYGPQHPVISTDMAEIYGEIYDAVKMIFPKEKFSRFFPLRGSKYDEAIQLSRLTPFEGELFPANEKEAKKYLEPAVRLMVVGRSVNGWTELMEKTRDEFIQRAAETIVFGGIPWLQDRCVQKILNQMKPITTIEQRWFEHIVWSELYPIVLLHSRNTMEKMQDVQLALSKELLLEQIEFYKPTHILFITDWDGGFERFADVFSEVSKVENSTKNNVVGVGTYGKAQVVVTVRPENRPNEDEFVADVCQAYNINNATGKLCEMIE